MQRGPSDEVALMRVTQVGPMVMTALLRALLYNSVTRIIQAPNQLMDSHTMTVVESDPLSVQPEFLPSLWTLLPCRGASFHVVERRLPLLPNSARISWLRSKRQSDRVFASISSAIQKTKHSW